MKKLFVLLFHCFVIILLVFLVATPVRAYVRENESCTTKGEKTLCLYGPEQKLGRCKCIVSARGLIWVFDSELPTSEGILNPVIGILGMQPGEETMAYLIAAFVRLAYLGGGILVLIYFIWGAIEWLTSGGEPESLQKARNRITNALIGIGILAFTYLAMVILGMILKIDILRLPLPSP